MGKCNQSGKNCYRSEDHAKRVMKRLSASLRSYRCKACGSWHLTKKHQ